MHMSWQPITLKQIHCLHAQSHVASPHRFPHTCLSQMREKHRFQNKRFLFLKTHYQVSINILDYHPRRISRSFFQTVMGSPPIGTVGPHSKAILRKIFLEIPFTTIFTFLFIFVSRTHTYHSRVPRCIWNAL